MTKTRGGISLQVNDDDTVILCNNGMLFDRGPLELTRVDIDDVIKLLQEHAAAYCKHEETERGAPVPLRYGTYLTLVCVRCRAFHVIDWCDKPRGSWRPASEYAADTAPREDDE